VCMVMVVRLGEKINRNFLCSGPCMCVTESVCVFMLSDRQRVRAYFDFKVNKLGNGLVLIAVVVHEGEEQGSFLVR